MQLEIQPGIFVNVSAEDFDRVSQHVWRIWDGYPYSKKLDCRLHQFIAGQRPDDVPAEWVVDHADRDIYNADKSNLRWVTPSFNSWNRDCLGTGMRGTTWLPQQQKWSAVFCSKRLGSYCSRQEAFVAYATAAVQKWPLWAPTSGLLVGEGLLTKAEMQRILETVPSKKVLRELPQGVCLVKGRYMVYHRRKHIGYFDTLNEASTAWGNAIWAERELKWIQHVAREIPLDESGQALIPLSGKRGNGAFTTVPPELYHTLTFGHSWNVDGDGYVTGTWSNHSRKLHQVVWLLLHPFYILPPGHSIDHINQNPKDNSETNLRPASKSLQGRNKKKRTGMSSRYVGVCKVRGKKPWRAAFIYEGSHHYVGTYATEVEADQALKQRQRKVIRSDDIC